MKKKFLLSLIVFHVFLFLTGCASSSSPKYVFLFIGDGMGKPHVELARQIYGPLNMDKLPVHGSVSTVNFEKKTTDSAASGTAYACGVKTKNGRLGMDADGQNVDSCAVLAKRQGRSVAILTTVGANNATPAAFYAHVPRRSESKKIMEQYSDAHFDILAGSGIDGMKTGVKQEDFLNGKAYQLKNNATQTTEDYVNTSINVIAKKDKPFFELTSLNRPVFVYSKGTDNLDQYVKKSIELMTVEDRGFFMMAEGGHIDHGGHSNNVSYMLSELMKFDKAIGVAIDFYKKHPRNTLIVVSADHHTGGLKLREKIRKDTLLLTLNDLKIDPAKDSEEAIYSKLAEKKIACTYEEKVALNKVFQEIKPELRGGSVKRAVEKVIDRHSGIQWTTSGHTSDEVYLFAIGKYAERFEGHQENSDVGAKLKAFYAK